ncbi:MAG: Prophage endopeptidase tail [Bacteriophage sp.]|nr:MAG: Prophage endopeptidase tail [Bacteriophage sp.]
MILQIKRGNRVIAESADFSYSPSLQEVRKLTCEVVSVVPIEFKAYNSKSESEYDTVVYNGNTFILYQAPSGDNLNEAGKYKYSLLFYGKEVLLQNVAFLDIVSGTGGEINKIRYTHGGLFQFWGDAKQLAARIEANIESYNASLGAGYTGIGTWTLNVDAEGELTEDMIDITDGTNLFEALKFFYDKFYLNYYFSTTANGGIITITDKARPSVNWTFKQGDGGGAVKVSSSVDTSTPVITRIIPQGGSRNVPPEYKKDAKPADESRYCPYILLPNDSAGNIRYYIDSEYGLKNYGVRGKTISNTFSGIYPSIRGKKLGDLYPSGLPEWDTYKADGEPDPQSGKVAGEGASAATRIDKIIGSTPIKSDDSDSFFIYMTSPGFNLGYKVYEDGDSSDKINDNVQPQYKPHAMFDKYRDFESFDIYGTRAYYDQPVKVTATFSGKMLFSILPIGSDAVGKKVKINLRMVTNRVLGQASPLKEVVIGEEGATGMLEIPYDKTSLVGYIEKGQNTTVTIRVEFTFDSDVPAGSCKIGFSEEMTCNIHFGNQDGSQDRFYYKYASVTDAVFSMRTGTYTGTEFKINKNGIIPLYGEVNGDTGETEEDVAMFNKGARYKISCYRTDSDNAKLPLYTDGKSPSIAAGTEFVILNIVMPESYVTMAENTLEKAAIDYLSRYDHENRTVSLDISSGFVAEHPNLFIDFIEGNMLKVRDDGIGVFDFSDNGQIVDMQLQIQSLEIKYSKENMFPSYSCTIARRKILSFYERLAQENQAASTQNTTNVTLGGSGTGSGTNIFSEQLLNDLIASFQKFNGWFEWDEVNQALRCKSAFYTNQWISALGAQSGSGEPGGGEGGLIKAVYGFADLGKTFDDSNLSNTFNAYTINEIWKLAKEGGMNTDKLWQELGKDDPTKKIHISHIPDNKFVTLDTEQTVTASKIFTGQLSTANVVPSVNNASTLGLESKRWENIYAVDANISGTVKTQSLQVGDIKIIYDSVNKAVTFEHIDGSTEIGFYTRGWISALGVSPGGSGGSGGDGLVKNVYGFSNLGTTFSDSDLDNTFNAYTINEIWKMAKEGGGIKNITQSGSGNAVTDMTLSSDGKTITAVFGETFARQQDLGTLNNTVTQLSNKLNNFLEGSDADNIINKWKELEAFLDGLTESDNLAELLALKADKTITISAGTGLTGGGNLSANRTLSLATTGVKAGTYTKVTVDTYGRVTVGDNPTTLAGYGITDAVTLTTAQTISGRKTFSQNIVFNNNGGITYPDGNVALRNSDGHTILASFGDGSINLRPNGHNNTEGAVWINKVGNVQAPSVSTNAITIGDAQLVYDSVNKALRVKHRTDGNTVGFYSDGWVSALGVKTGGSGSGSGVVNTVYSFANLTDGTTFSDSDLDNTFNAYTIKKLYDMAGQGGLDADAMWAELKKADSSKVIDASHIPTSVLDGRWVKKTGDTMTGTLTSASSSGSIVFKGLENCDITNIYKDNGVIRNDDGGLTSIRNGLRFNWYDTYWYIGNLRGSSTDSAGFGVVDHNNKLVLRVTPNDVRAPRFMSTVATGLSPLIVSSNTTVDNLSADLLDGYHAFGTSNALIKYGYTVGGTEPAWCRIATYSIRNTETMTDVCFVLHSSFSDLFGLLVVKTRGTAVVEGLLIASYNINRSNIRIYHDAEKKNIELYCYGGSNYSIIQANLLYSHDRYGEANTNITLYQADTKAPSWSTYVNPVFANLQNSSEAAKKLQTPRTLWGQSFDGTANVSGDMTGVGSITMSGDLKIGNATSPNTIYFYGTTGDGPGGYNHTFIAERFWGGTESGELVLFKGNDLSPSDTDATTVGGTGPDRIRHIAAAHLFQTYASPISGTVESICTSSALRNLFSIAPGRVVSYIPLQSIVASGTAPFIVASNTVVGNLNADLLDGLHENSFLRYRDVYGIDGYNTLWSQIGIRQYNNAKPDGMANPIYNYGAVVSLPASGPRLDIWYNHTSSASDYNTNGIQYRSGFNDDKKPWRMLLDSVNYASYSDGRYVKKAGDTMTGALHLANGTRNNAGDDCGFGDCNIAGCLGLQGLNGATGLAFIQQGASWSGGNNYKFTWNGSNMVSSSTALWNNLNADMLDNWHLNFLPRNYNIGRCYAVKFALGGEDNGWKKIFACSESGATPYRSVTVWGRIWYAYGNHAQSEVWNYHFCAIFYMRSGPSSSDSSVGNVENSARLYLPTFAKGMDNIRLVRVGTNNFELQVRQIGPYHNANIEYQYWSYGCNVSAWENLQSTSNTSVAVSAGGASTLADSRASSADVWTTARTFYIQDHDSSHTGAGVNVNGGSNVYLKLPSSIQCSDWFRSTGNSGWYHQNYGGGIYMQDSSWVRVFGGKRFYVENGDNTDFSTATAISTSGGIYARKNITSSANIIATGAITAKASSSDIRLKTDIQDYDAMGIIRKFQSVKYHWNNLAKRNSEIFNHKKWNYGLIAQDLLSGGYSQWVSDIFKDYYTIDYERLIPVVWKGLQEVDDEVTRLKKRVRELEKRLGINN